MVWVVRVRFLREGQNLSNWHDTSCSYVYVSSTSTFTLCLYLNCLIIIYNFIIHM